MSMTPIHRQNQTPHTGNRRTGPAGRLPARPALPRRTSTPIAATAIALLSMAAFAVLPVAARSAPSNPAQVMALSTQTLTPDADAYVSQSAPTTNYGTSTALQVNGNSGAAQNAYIRFTVSSLSGSVQSAMLRVYSTSHSKDGPAVYQAGNTWTESGSGGITWNTRLGPVSGAVDNAAAISRAAWVQYNVTSLVTGTGTYTFALLADTSNASTFSSREGANPPQLVITTSTAPSPTPTTAPTHTPNPIASPTPTVFSTQPPTATSAAGTIVLSPSEDSYVDSSLPSNNFGTANPLIASASVRRALLKFGTGVLAGDTINSVSLRVFSKATIASGGYEIHPELTTWAENTVTWNTQPSWNATILATSPSPVSGAWTAVALPVTSVNSTGDTAYGVRYSVSGYNAQFSAREDAVNPPQLVITYSGASTALPTNTATPVASPTHTPTPGPSGSIQHVFLVMMENHSYSEVWNTSSSPYITQLGNSYARATNYFAITHPSLPNYLDIYGGSNYGITTDCDPSSSCHVSATNLADNLEAKGLTWRGYMESMPSACYLTSSGTYAPKHDPFVYFDDIRNNATRCNSHVVPYSDLSGDLASASTTPNFAFITPNLCDDMHDCSVSTGDTWLSNNLPAILGSPACTAQTCLLMLTWDEDDNSAGNHVLTIFAGSGAKTGGVTSSASYVHFSLLRTVENIFGLPTQTSNDAAASPMNDLLR